MVEVSFEILNKLERVSTRKQKNPWQWKGQIILKELTQSDRLKLGLPINNSTCDVIPITGNIEPGQTAADAKKTVLSEINVKIAEIKEQIAPPKIETMILPVNQVYRESLSTLEQINAAS